MKRRQWILLILSIAMVAGLGGTALAQQCEGTCNEDEPGASRDGCTSFMFGKDATVDGSMIIVHNDACSNSRIHVVPAMTFPAGTLADAWWGLQNIRKGSTFLDYGDSIGKIPQVASTYKYFHTGYPMLNEHQLAIGETTISQRNELRATYGACKQIMTIEQAQLFALQRCTTAREAIVLMTSLLETYGYLPSCCGAFDDGECLLVGDPDEQWILEVFSVGNSWQPGSGVPGALWAAQRVPNDHIKLEPNCPTIGEIDLSQPDWFMASSNYMSYAVERGWYDPASGDPFVWYRVYGPPPTEGNMLRFYLFYSTYCPSLMKHRVWNTIDYYPFSAKPDNKVSVQDAMAFSRHMNEGTVWDMSADLDWYVQDSKGNWAKSPLTTPVPTREMRDLLDITWHRPIASGGYAIIAQLRDWLPDPIGGVYWFIVDFRPSSIYVPIYAGVTEINPLWSLYNGDVFQPDSFRWAVRFVDTLMNSKYQAALPILKSVRDPLEASFFAEQAAVDATALALYNTDPAAAEQYLTNYTWEQMDEAMQAYVDLRYKLIVAVAPSYSNPPTTGGSYRGDDFVPAWPK